jgi:hypothetical protein
MPGWFRKRVISFAYCAGLLFHYGAAEPLPSAMKNNKRPEHRRVKQPLDIKVAAARKKNT